MRRHARSAAVLVALAAAAVLFAIDRSPGWKRLTAAVAEPEARLSPAKARRLSAQLGRYDLLFLRPPADLHELRPAGADGRCPDPEVGLGPVPPDEHPSFVLGEGPARFRSGLVASLYLEPCRRRRLATYTAGRGRRFEEPGWITFFEAGRPIFSTVTGVRLHGGVSREQGVKSFRLELRPRFGARGLPGPLLRLPASRRPGSVVLDFDYTRPRGGSMWFLVSGIAYDIARRAGARAPATRPVALIVNGERPLPFLLTERVDDTYLEQTFGEGDYELIRGKPNPGQKEPRRNRELREWIARQPAPFDQARAAERFDVDELVRGLAALLFTATGEPHQSILVRDRRGGAFGGRWSWVLWDVDLSFVNRRSLHRFPGADDLLPFITDSSRNRDSVHKLLLRRLLREDPNFRDRLTGRVVEMLNHELTPEFLSRLAARYHRTATELGIEDVGYLERIPRWFEARRTMLYDELVEHLGAGPPLSVEVTTTTGRLRVDDHPVGARFRGLYPSGFAVRLAAGSALGPDPEWFVNGTSRGRASELVVVVTEPLRISVGSAPVSANATQEGDPARFRIGSSVAGARPSGSHTRRIAAP